MNKKGKVRKTVVKRPKTGKGCGTRRKKHYGVGLMLPGSLPYLRM